MKILEAVGVNLSAKAEFVVKLTIFLFVISVVEVTQPISTTWQAMEKWVDVAENKRAEYFKGQPSLSRVLVSNQKQATYKTKPNDSLWKIAKKFETDVDTLAFANEINPKDVLKPGKTLIVPNQ